MEQVRGQFPILSKSGLVYLDSAASGLKPQRVIDKVVEYYSKYSANIHRGVYNISERATEEYEKAREQVARFIGARSPREVVFVRNATEAINLVSYSWGETNIKKGDEIAITVMEHHANLVPWQRLADKVGAQLKYLDVDEKGRLLTDGASVEKWITAKTKLAAITQASNVVGTINDIKSIVAQIKKINPKVVVVVDGAQSTPRLPVDVEELGCDFYAVTGHKMYGPTGIGVLWGREELLIGMPPFLSGGGMIEEVGFDKTIFAKVPEKFEAGTPHIAGAIALGEAAKFLTELGMENVWAHEVSISRYALNKLSQVEGLSILGPDHYEERTAIFAFTVAGIHPHDLSQLLNEENVAVRAGHHCAMPLHKRLGIAASTRASAGVYTDTQDIDRLVEAIEKAKKRLA